MPAGALTRSDVEALVAWWQPRLAPGWRVFVAWEQIPDEDARAMVDLPDDYSVARLRLRPGWEDGWSDDALPGDEPAAELEVSVVHELLHVALRDMDRAFELAAGELGEQARAVAAAGFGHATETFTERAARLLVALRSDITTRKGR